MNDNNGEIDLNQTRSQSRQHSYFDEELGDLNDKRLNPTSLPEVGQLILFWDPISNSKKIAQITKMCQSVQLKNPGWRNVKVRGESNQRSINLDLVSDNCIRWQFLNEDNSPLSDNALETFRTEGEVPPIPVSPLNLDLPHSNIIEDNRVYRLPPAPNINPPVFQNLRITVSNPSNDSEEPFDRNDPRRTVYQGGRSRLARYWSNFKKN